ncbi:hypothetical protein NMG60_11007945 [Bertholletia excelsa]
MVQRTVLKVDVSDQKSKKKLLKAVTGLKGVDKIEVDEARGTLSVTGDADPYEIITRTRKAGKFAQVVTIGPPPAPPKQQQEGQKKPDEKKPDDKKSGHPYIHTPYSCPICAHMALFPAAGWEEPSPSCSIM